MVARCLLHARALRDRARAHGRGAVIVGIVDRLVHAVALSLLLSELVVVVAVVVVVVAFVVLVLGLLLLLLRIALRKQHHHEEVDDRVDKDGRRVA